MNRQRGLLSFIQQQIVRDRVTTAILSTFVTVSSILILLMGISVWPAILSRMNGEGTAAALCRAAFRTNLVLLIVYLVITGAFLLYEHGFSFVKTTLINVCIGGLVNLVMLLMQQRLVLGGEEAYGFMNELLWFIVSFLFSWILALLPALLIGGVAQLIHTIFFKLYDWRHGG